MMKKWFLLLAVASLYGCDSNKMTESPAGQKIATIEDVATLQPHLSKATLSEAPPARTSSFYVPAYSHIYSEDDKRQVDLSVTLSIRNTDATNPIVLTKVDYYSTAGKLLKSYLDGPVQLGPMGSADYVINRTDSSGGSGANFIVNWQSAKKVSTPIIESVMVSTGAPQSMAFSSRGEEISGGGAEISTRDKKR